MVFDGISDSVKAFSPDNLFNVFDTPALAKVWIFIKIFVYFIGFLAAVIAIYKLYLQYKIIITIKSRLGGGGLEIKRDRAKIVVDKQNKTKLVLYKTRKGRQALTLPVPPAIYKSKIGKKDHYELWLDDNFQLHPITPPSVEKGKDMYLEVRPASRDAWARSEDKLLREKYNKKDLLDKYLPAGILIISMITAFLIWFFAAKQLGAGLSALALQFAQIASTCSQIGVN